MNRIQNLDCFQKTVLVRGDLNVPVKNGVVTDSTRLESLQETIRFLKSQQAKIVVLSHFGRPTPADSPNFYEKKYSLEFLRPILQETYGIPFSFVSNCIGNDVQKAMAALPFGAGLLLENVRFHAGEENNAAAFSKALSQGIDIYVNDAFSCSHRAHASMVGITHFLPSAAGFSLQKELDTLTPLFESPDHPLIALVGGSKVSTKLDLLQNLCAKVDYVLVGGAMAHTFWVAMGYGIGKSLYEPDYVETAHRILQTHGNKIKLPIDCVVANRLENPDHVWVVPFNEIPEEAFVFDVGPETISRTGELLRDAKMFVWNGPVGAFEFPPFHEGTVATARMIGKLSKQGTLKSVAGGGDTLAALDMADVKDQFTYLSTAGGAFLEWLEGKTLPGVAALDDN